MALENFLSKASFSRRLCLPEAEEANGRKKEATQMKMPNFIME
jgi:hypothetical protein